MKTESHYPPPRRYKTVVYFICLVGALGGLLFGLDQGFIANSLEGLEAVYHLDTQAAGRYSALFAIGGLVGALSSGFLARFLGRKKSLMLAGFLFTTGALVSATLPDFLILQTCRLFLGISVGMASFVTPLYLAETAPASIRGTMGVLFQIMLSAGIFLVSAIDVHLIHLSGSSQSALPMMFLVIASFSMLMFLGSLGLPESPRWLMLKGKKSKAMTVLKRTFNTQSEIDFEIQEIEQVLSEDKDSVLKSIFHKHFFKVLAIGIAIQMFQQLVGVNIMIYYSPTIFGYAGIKGITAMMAVPTANMLFSIPALFLIERWGRKKLLCAGAIIMAISLLLAGFSFHLMGQSVQSAVASEMPKTILIVVIVTYMFGFAFSWGPVAWILCSEIFPLKGREIGMTVTTMINWAFAVLVIRYALSLMERFGQAPVFYLFSGLCVLALLFVIKFVPETKGVTLEELEEQLKGVDT